MKKRTMKILGVVLALVFALSSMVFATAASAEDDVAVDENITTSDIENLSLADRFKANHYLMDWEFVYYGVSYGDPEIEPEDLFANIYFITDGESIVSVYTDDSGMTRLISREGVVSEYADGTLEVIDFSEDEAAREQFISNIEGPLLFAEDPKEKITNVEDLGDTVLVTLEYEIAESARQYAWENVWGITEGQARFEVEIDKESRTIIGGSEYFIDEEGNETLVYLGTVTYDDDVVLPDDAFTDVEDAYEQIEGSESIEEMLD